MECVQCPAISEKLDLSMGFLGVLVALLLAAFVMKRHCGKRLREPVGRMAARLKQLELVQRCKLLFTFYQIASQITTVYNVRLSGSSKDLYEASVAVLSWATFDWDGASHHTPHRLGISRILTRTCVTRQATSCPAN
eukprot:scaffold77694_cov77-Phaeocystis_antarctica.AAC.1